MNEKQRILLEFSQIVKNSWRNLKKNNSIWVLCPWGLSGKFRYRYYDSDVAF